MAYCIKPFLPNECFYALEIEDVHAIEEDDGKDNLG